MKQNCLQGWEENFHKFLGNEQDPSCGWTGTVVETGDWHKDCQGSLHHWSCCCLPGPSTDTSELENNHLEKIFSCSLVDLWNCNYKGLIKTFILDFDSPSPRGRVNGWRGDGNFLALVRPTYQILVSY